MEKSIILPLIFGEKVKKNISRSGGVNDYVIDHIAWVPMTFKWAIVRSLTFFSNIFVKYGNRCYSLCKVLSFKLKKLLHFPKFWNLHAKIAPRADAESSRRLRRALVNLVFRAFLLTFNLKSSLKWIWKVLNNFGKVAVFDLEIVSLLNFIV